MADQNFGVKCGFWDAVNYDRTYSADDMNKPYSRLIADGVFAANDGTPSSDLQVTASGSGMNISVLKGQGIFSKKWFENTSSVLITVPENTALYTRIDSVLVQIDRRTSGRAGYIVYRTGTPAATPEPPAINQISGVIEYRLANVSVEAAATSISQADITDLRGSEACPWVTGLIKQVDTSTLWAQFQAAYAAQYEQYTADNLAYLERQRQAWEDFLATLTDELTVSTNVVSYTNVYTSEASVDNIPIGIASYAPETDILQVYINGLLATPGTDYALAENRTSVDLTETLLSGQVVVFVVYKSLIGASIESAVSLIERLDDKINGFTADSGWVTLELQGSVTAADDALLPAVRQIDSRVYLRGSIKGIEAADTLVALLPACCRPAEDVTFTSAAVTSGGVIRPVTITLEAASGEISVSAVGTIAAADGISIACAFLANYSADTPMIYDFRGNANAYADLPASPKAGDVYMVLSADPTHFIQAGDSVLWNGSAWQIVTARITSAQIDAIINSIE